MGDKDDTRWKAQVAKLSEKKQKEFEEGNVHAWSSHYTTKLDQDSKVGKPLFWTQYQPSTQDIEDGDDPPLNNLRRDTGGAC